MIRVLLTLVLEKCSVTEQWYCEEHQGGTLIHSYEVEYSEFAGQSFGGHFEDVTRCYGGKP